MVNEADRDISVPRNVMLYGVTRSGALTALTTNLSGELSVDVTIGDVIAIISGQIYVYSGEIHVLSGSVTLGSGGNGIGSVGINSGHVSVQSGEVHILSGTVDVQILSGSISVSSGDIHVNSGTVNLGSGGQSIGKVGINSGVVAIQSGEIHVSSGSVTAVPITDSVSIFSGYGTTFSLVYSGFGFNAYNKAVIGLINTGTGGSGVTYTIRGYLISGDTPISLTSGTLYSGAVARESLSNPYHYVDVGVIQTQSGFSSSVTVFVTRRQ